MNQFGSPANCHFIDMKDTLAVTVVIINYKTPELLDQALGSMRKFYPAIQVLLIDNGSCDEKNPGVMMDWRSRFPQQTELLFNSHNLHHGPAIDQAMHHATSPFVLLLDSDCEVLRGGFIEEMVQLAVTSPLHYAVGKRVWMDRRGFDLPSATAGAIPYVRPICILIRRATYLTLPKAKRHGAPLLANMREAARRGFLLVDFPVGEYVFHKGRGTAAQHGYGLGWRGRVNFLLHKLRL